MRKIKNLSRLIALAIIMAMAFSLLACTIEPEEETSGEESTTINNTHGSESESGDLNEKETNPDGKEPDETDSTASESVDSSEKETDSDSETSSETDANASESETTSETDSTVTESEEASESETEEMIDGHTVKNFEDVEPTAYTTGFKGGKYCSVCKKILESREIIPMLSTTTPLPESSKVTVEEWKNAFDLIKLNSFTMLYQSKSIRLTPDADLIEKTLQASLEEALAANSEEILIANFSNYVLNQQTDGLVKYNSGDIYSTVSEHSIRNDTTRTVSKGGSIAFDLENKFREVDWFCGIQPAEILDDSVYYWEDYGYYMATYSEESKSYVIETKIDESVSCHVDICFQNGHLVGYNIFYTDGYSRSECIIIFSDINENKPVAEVTPNGAKATFESAKAKVQNATGCTVTDHSSDETSPFSINEILSKLDKTNILSVKVYYLENGKLRYVSFECTVEGVEYQEGETDSIDIGFDDEERIVMVDIASDSRYLYNITY